MVLLIAAQVVTTDRGEGAAAATRRSAIATVSMAMTANTAALGRNAIVAH